MNVTAEFLVDSLGSNFYKLINRNFVNERSSINFSVIKKNNENMNIIFGLFFLAASFTILTSVLNNFDNKVYGQVGSFLTVSGSEYKDVRDSETLHLQKFSLGGWFKTGNNFSENGFIVNKGGAGLESKGTNLNYGIWMSRDETINAGFETEDGQNYVVSSVKKYADNQWHYVFVTYDGKKLKLYMDGRIVSEAVAEAKPDSTGSQPVRIGANSFNASKFFVGEIDEIRLWDRVLTDNEVNEGYLFNKFNIRDQILYASFSSEKVPVPMNIPVPNYQDNIISDFLAKQNKDLTSAIQDFDIYQKSPIQDFAAGDCKQYSDKLPVSKIKSSGALSSYPNKNVNDGNLDTRWSVLGLGSYIQLDLGTQKKICHAYIAWFRGDERQMTFTISISSDGKSFKKVFSGTTSGKTESFEHYSFANTKGRYVKITVTDSTMNDWVSISEIKVNGLPLSFTPPPSPPQ
ncbi:MAG: hypothetical protein DA328_08145, partial [Nitrososphaeraceae archaeon]|nr:hypothetical protein [Nitrososphaeraceae archaeon]